MKIKKKKMLKGGKRKNWQQERAKKKAYDNQDKQQSWPFMACMCNQTEIIDSAHRRAANVFSLMLQMNLDTWN